MVACIDIGSNTTRLLVATSEHGRLRAVHAERAYTSIGATTEADGSIPAGKVAEVAGVARMLCESAFEHGAEEVAVVATAAVRRAPNAREVVEAVARSCGHELRVLSGAEEAALSFAGACHVLDHRDGSLAVVDVGGGSTEIAVGLPGEGVRWSASVDVGSASLTHAHVRDDPPEPAQVEGARSAARAALGSVVPPTAGTAVAVGGTATALLALTGAPLTAAALDGLCERVCAAPAESTAGELGLDPERVRLLPAGLAILRAATELLDAPLGVVRGGLREGVALELSQPGRRSPPGAGAP